jgi:hypothetical protein
MGLRGPFPSELGITPDPRTPAYGEREVMTTNGIHPYLAAQIARYRADDLVREAADARRARFTRRSRRAGRQ